MWVRWLSVVLAAVLVATVGVPATAEPEPAPVEGTGDVEVAAPAADDVVAASVNARASGEPVEVVSARDEFSSTWVNPDGSFTTQESLGQVRFRDGDQGWVDVDLDLAVLPDGRVAPKGHPAGLVLAGEGVSATEQAQSSGTLGSGVDLAAVSHGEGRQVVVGLPRGVGEPTLEGPAATYRGVWPGVDVVVDARRSGFEQWFVLTDRDTVGALPGGDVVSWSLPVKTKGLTAKLEADGSVAFRDAQGVVVSTLVAPQAWDAVVDQSSGLPSNRAPVTLGISQRGRGRATLTVSVDRAWVMHEDRVFPVTVDPTYASATASPSFDTRATQGIVTPAPSDPELWAGTYSSGTNIARSYLNFSTAPFKNKQVMSAELSLYQTWAWSCRPSVVNVHEANASATSTTVWTNKPTHVVNVAGSTSAARRSDGGGDCAQGRIKIPMTSLVQAWSTGTATSETVVVKAADETDNEGWKRFSSAEGSAPPMISYTYNRVPATPTGLKLADGDVNAYQPPGSSTTQWWTAKARPMFQASTTDADAKLGQHHLPGAHQPERDR